MALQNAIATAKKNKYAIIGGGNALYDIANEAANTPASAGVHYTTTQGPGDLGPESAGVHTTETLGPGETAGPESAGIHYTSTLGPGDVGTRSYKPSSRTLQYQSTLDAIEGKARPSYSASSRVRSAANKLSDYDDAYKPEYTQNDIVSDYQRRLAELENSTPADYTPNERVTGYRSQLADLEGKQPGEYTPSDTVNDYRGRLGNYEDAKKPEWQSRYEPAIQSILDGILNQKGFNLNDDANYQTLYNQYAQSYMNQGNRAMRDTLGNAAALTGGYGSTAAQAAASQAYDNYMSQLNDQNIQLMNLAYGMYQDELANRYNQLGAVTGLDNTDYGRYRDDVSDFYTDRDYWANRLQQEYANDYGKYRDTVNDYMQNRNYLADMAAQAYAEDYGQHRDAVSDYMQNRNYTADRLAQEYAKDYGQYRDDVSDFYTDRNYWTDRYNNEYAMDYGQFRDQVADYENDRAYAANRYAQEYANDYGEYGDDRAYDMENDKWSYSKYQDALNLAMKYAAQGLPIPSYLAKQIQDYTGEEDINNVIAAMPVAAGGSGGSGGGGRRSSGGKDTEEKITPYPRTANDYYNSLTHTGAKDEITNRNGDGWVYVAGIGRLTYEELRNQVKDGTIKETRKKNKYTYTKA